MFNTMPPDAEYPAHEERGDMTSFSNLIRWNAAAMVAKGAKKQAN